MNDFDSELRQRLEALDLQGLRRGLKRVESPQGTAIRINGRTLLNFSSNDYLGLANHPRLKAGAEAAVERYGAGAGASRLICGSLGCHHELEERLADFKKAPAALAFGSGYAAALGTVCALAATGDVIVLDRLVHASVVDAARLSGAKLRVFPHNDLGGLEKILKWSAARGVVGGRSGRRPRTLIVTESLFSMDGDLSPLREIVQLKHRYGAWLMVDEAHATGVYGPNRRGWAEATGVEGEIDIQMGTLGKAFGAAGGYICGSRTLIDYLVNQARSFIFSTAPVPAAAGAAAAAVELVASQEGAARCARLWQLIRSFEQELGRVQNPAGGPILPVIIGDESRAMEASRCLQENGFYVPAVRYPTVARGKARLRVTITAGHSPEEVERLAGALRAIRNLPGPEMGPGTPK